MSMLDISVRVDGQEINSPDANEIGSHDWFDVQNDRSAACVIARRDGNPFPEGWLLLRARLEREGEQLEAILRYSRANSDVVELDLPISLKGTLLELINIPSGVKQLILQPMCGAGRFRISQTNIKHVGLFERVYRMCTRVAAMFEHHPYEQLAYGFSKIALNQSFSTPPRLEDLTPA